MKTNDKTIEALIASNIKSLGLDEPSAEFTLKVMQSIAEQPAISVTQRNYWWLLTLIPILAGIGWYILLILKLTGYITRFWESIVSGIQPYVNTIISLPDQFKSIKVSPLLFIGFVAIIMLLTIEELYSRAKHTS